MSHLWPTLNRLPTVVALGFGIVVPSTSLATAVDDLKPGKLRQRVVGHFEDGDSGWTAVVTDSGEVWAGATARMSRVADVRVVPTGTRVVMEDGHLIIWSTRRTGLRATTELWAIHEDGGLTETVLDTYVLDARVGQGGQRVAVLLPGELLVLDHDGKPPHRTPLPWTHPSFDDSATDGIFINGRGWPAGRVELKTGCVEAEAPKRPAVWPLVQWAAHREACGGVSLPTPEQAAHAAAWAEWRAHRAAVDGDAVMVAALGYRGAALEQLRPAESPEPGALAFGGLGQLTLDAALTTAEPVAIVHDLMPGTHPGLLVGGLDGAACVGAVVLVEADLGRREWLTAERDKLARAGVRCSEHLHVVSPAEVPEREDDAGVRYVDITGKEQGWRSGTVGPGWLRDDMARFSSDPILKQLVAEARTLSPEYTLAPGAGGVLGLDVNDSWLGAVGWEFARATAEGFRESRMALPGPVSAIHVDADGRYDVLVGGHHAKVLFEGGTLGNTTPPLEWVDEWTLAPQRQRRERQLDWPVEGDQLRLPGQDHTLEVGGRPVEVEAWPRGAIVRTRAGLVGVWPDGAYAWRIPDATGYVHSEDLLVVSTRYGISAYRPPLKPLPPMEKVEEAEQPDEAPPPGGGRRGPKKGGPRGGGGPQGGGPQGGGPQGGGPQGGGPQGGGPQGGGPQQGGR